MEKLKKFYTNSEMSWKRVIIFAIIIAIFTGLINSLTFLRNTSFQDIAINYDWWFIFAIYIVINCKSIKEACLKCFVFFLISQPLIFLIEVPFNPDGFGIFIHYRHWFNITILTLPGAAICYMLKRKDWLAVIVLAVPIAFFGYMTIYYLKMAIASFPNHLLSAILVILLSLFLIFALLEDKKKKIVCICVLLVSLLVSSISMSIYKRQGTTTIDLGQGNWLCEIEDESIIDIEISEDNIALFKTEKTGNTYVCFTNEKGEKIECYVNVNGNEIFVSVVD